MHVLNVPQLKARVHVVGRPSVPGDVPGPAMECRQAASRKPQDERIGRGRFGNEQRRSYGLLVVKIQVRAKMATANT